MSDSITPSNGNPSSIQRWITTQVMGLSVRAKTWLKETVTTIRGIGKVAAVMVFCAFIWTGLVIYYQITHNQIVGSVANLLFPVLVLYGMVRVIEHLNMTVGTFARFALSVALTTVIMTSLVSILSQQAGGQPLDILNMAKAAVTRANSYYDNQMKGQLTEKENELRRTKDELVSAQQRVDELLQEQVRTTQQLSTRQVQHVTTCHLKAALCRGVDHCAIFFNQAPFTEGIELPFIPTWGIAEDGWALSGQQRGVEVSRVQQGWKELIAPLDQTTRSWQLQEFRQ